MSQRYRRAAGATEQRVSRSLFLANPERGSLYRLNETFAGLWNLLAEPCAVEEAVAMFRQAFPKVPARRMRDDVAQMFVDLWEEGLIESVEPEGP